MLPDEAEPNSSGRPFLLRWFGSIFAEDEYTRAATRRVLMELGVFYVLIAIGFLCMWLTWRSNANLKKWKADLATAMARQRGRQFEPSDAAKLYGMF